MPAGALHALTQRRNSEGRGGSLPSARALSASAKAAEEVAALAAAAAAAKGIVLLRRLIGSFAITAAAAATDERRVLDLDAVGGGVGGDKKDEEGKEGDGSDAADARVTLDRTRRGGKEDDKTPLLPLAALLQSMKDGMRLSHKQREVERRIPRAVARRETERLAFLRPIEKCRRAFFFKFRCRVFFLSLHFSSTFSQGVSCSLLLCSFSPALRLDI